MVSQSRWWGLLVLLFLGSFLLAAMADVVGASAIDSSTERAQKAAEALHNKVVKKDIYFLSDHVLRVVVYLSLSAVFAGLTIGIMCIDALTIDIIATSGPEPDRTYASRILPLRRQGHQTLCTLIISNMLLNVLVVQEIGEIFRRLQHLELFLFANRPVRQNDDLTAFVISTLIILIFTEIVPMSVCKSKYSLQIAAAGCVVVRVAMVLVYPVAMPLGKLLDCFVPHDAGQIYDRNELRKLMVLHCEAHKDRSGLDKSEVALLMAAMDFHERKSCDIMLPIEQTTSASADDVITMELIEHFWKRGRSRIPVRDSRDHYIGVLLVKDLIIQPISHDDSRPMTIGEFVRSKSRSIAVVSEHTLLPVLLRLFQECKTHMIFVSQGNNENDENAKGNADNFRVSFFFPGPFYDENRKIVGIITLEDVTEALIEGEIYDEYDHYGSYSTDYPNRPSSYTHIHRKEILMPLEEPPQPPRANFYSYYVNPSSEFALTSAQVWAVAYYLTRAVDAFFLWHPGYVKMLLDECGDEQLIPPWMPLRDDLTNQNLGSASLLSPVSDGQNNIPFSESRMTQKEFPMGNMRHERHVDLSSLVSDEKFVLYREGVETDVFTLVLGGAVEMSVGSSKFPLKRRSFEWLAEKALTSSHYKPEFDAVVLSPARVYRIPRKLYAQYLCYNTAYGSLVEQTEVIGKRQTETAHCSSKVVITQRLGGTGKSNSHSDDKEGLLQERQKSNLYGTFYEKA